MKTTGNAKTYWLTFDAADLVRKIQGVDFTYRARNGNPLLNMWLRNSYAYYSTIFEAQSWMTALQFTGEQGELVKMSVPQSRTLVRDAVTLVTKQKLAFQALAKVEDTEVTEQMRVANALAAQVVIDQRMDLLNELMVEHGFVLGTGFMKAIWRSDKGRPRAVEVLSQDEETGEEDLSVVYDGDLEVSVPLIFDLLYDFTIPRWDDLDWVKERVKRNRWSLIEQHPELEEEILKLPSCSTDDKARNWFGLDDLDDMVYVHELYAKPTPALPRGRMVVFANERAVFFDEENPYGCIPIEQYKPEPLMALNAGYPLLSNLLPAQEMYDHDLSAIATNHSATAVQNIACPRGSNVSVQQILGMNWVDYTADSNLPNGGVPTALELTKTAAEVFKFPEMLLANMQGMSRINAAVRGDLPSSTSGVAIATLTTNALEFFSGYAKADQDVLKKTMMNAVSGFRRFAKVERQVSIVGKNNQRYLKPFTGGMLEPITGFEMQMVNPMMQTMAGRLDIAEKAIANGLVTDIKSWAMILDGQPLSNLYEDDLSEEDLISAENEMMLDGEEPPILSIDTHPMHIYKHRKLLNDPRIRADSARAQVVLAHILKHDELAKNTDPMLQGMAATGKMPEGAMMAPPTAGPEGAPPPGMEAGGPMPLAEGEPAPVAEDLLNRSA